MTLTPQEGRETVVDLVLATIEQLAHTRWWPSGSACPAEVCSASGAGAAYGFDLWAPQSSNPAVDALRVAHYWESLGMTVLIVDGSARPTVRGEGGPVLRANFDTGVIANLYCVTAITPCLPGIADPMLDGGCICRSE